MIYTIGHSTRSPAEFLELLRAHQISQLADIRRAPHSRRHPHFNKELLESDLRAHGIAYRHFPQLGGLRRPGADSPNTAWRETGFRGFADYMASPAFEDGLASLVAFSTPSLTAIMCAESVWWKCHRRLLADALLVRGIPVFHILSSSVPKPHELSEFARVLGTRITYPGLV